MKITFTVPGPVKGKGRPLFSRMGKFVKVRTPEATMSYENLVKICFLNAREDHEWPVEMSRDVPLRMSIGASFQLPKSWSKKKKAQAKHAKCKPDIDNIIKIVMDALNGIAYADDCQVVSVRAFKIYKPVQEVVVSIETEEN